MNRTWDFLKYASVSEQNILLQAMKVCNVEVKNFGDVLAECNKMYVGMSYFDMLKKTAVSLKLSLSDEEIRSERLLIGHIGYFLLEHDESFRLKISSREVMPRDKNKFKSEFFLQLKTSEVFWFKITMYVFWYYHMNIESTCKDDSFSDIFRKRLVSSILPFGSIGVLGGIFRGGMFSNLFRLAAVTPLMPVLGVAASVAAFIWEINKSINKSFVEKLPIHITIIYLHIAHSYNISTIEEAKAVLRTAIMNASPQPVGEKYIWDDVRKGILKLIVPKLTVCNKDVVNRILSHKTFVQSSSLDTYLPQRIINQILSFNRKEIINFIYGFDVPNNKIRNFKLLESYHFKGRVLLKDYYFPYTQVNGKRFCLLEQDTFKSLLAQLFYEINNLDSKKLCLTKISGHYDFIQILNGPVEEKVCAEYRKYADTIVYCNNNTIYAKSLLEEEIDNVNLLKAEIAKLKKRICKLEGLERERDNLQKRLLDQEERCHRVKHDLEHLLSDIITPVKRYVKYKDNPKIKEESFEKFEGSIRSYDVLCKSWKILTQEEMHGTLEEVSIEEIVRMFDDFKHNIDNVNLELQNQITQKEDIKVYVSEYFKLQVVNNILSNLKEHAFADVDVNRKLYLRVSSDDVSVTISLENNGYPIASDDPECLFQYRLPNRKGIGLSNIRDNMRYAKGDFRIESNPDREYSTNYVLTFKIIN